MQQVVELLLLKRVLILTSSDVTIKRTGKGTGKAAKGLKEGRLAQEKPKKARENLRLLLQLPPGVMIQRRKIGRVGWKYSNKQLGLGLP